MTTIMADSNQVDHYDFINAPQFVDFDNLASHEDPHADKFFETHREEDDFMVPLDINNISPTVQLLYDNDDENEHYSNEANKAAMAAGLEDVKIEYYASPQRSAQSQSQPSSEKEKSVTSIYGTPLGTSVRGSAESAYYTPTGEDKENVTPVSAYKPEKLVSQKKSEGKQESAIIEVNTSHSQKSVLSERSIGGFTAPAPAKVQMSNADNPTTQSLYSQLDQLVLTSDSSDDEEDNRTVLSGHDGKLQEQLHIQDKSDSNPNGTFELDDSPNAESADVTLVCQLKEINAKPETFPSIPISPIHQLDASSDEEDEEKRDESAPMELGTPVKNILRKLEAELQMDIQNHASGDTEVNPRCSILVMPNVGQQIHWTPTQERSARNPPPEAINVSVSSAIDVSVSSGISVSASSAISVSTSSAVSAVGRPAVSRSRQPMKANHYVSMAEAMINFQKSTPDRFRSLPRGKTVPEKRSASCESRRRFSPSPPPPPVRAAEAESFTTKKDSRPTMARTGTSGLPKKVQVKPTIPKPFNFSTTHRSKPQAQAPKGKEDTDFKFKARPAPSTSRSTHENQMAKLRAQSKITQPMSPHFATDDRLKERSQKKADTTIDAGPKVTKSKPQPRLSRIPTASSSGATKAPATKPLPPWHH